MAKLDHMIIPSKDRYRSAALLAGLLDAPMDPDAMGMFSAVYVNPDLTIDFGEASSFDVHHYCFMVTDEEFEAVYGRLVAQGIPHRSSPHGPMDMQIARTEGGGKIVYWFDEDGHNWEILTQSYARQEM